jgi:hypothetical protein
MHCQAAPTNPKYTTKVPTASPGAEGLVDRRWKQGNRLIIFFRAM